MSVSTLAVLAMNAPPCINRVCPGPSSKEEMSPGAPGARETQPSPLDVYVFRMNDSPPTTLFINPLKKPPDIPDFISTLEDWATIAPGSTFNCSPLERRTVISVNAGPNSNSCSMNHPLKQSFLDSWGKNANNFDRILSIDDTFCIQGANNLSFLISQRRFYNISLVHRSNSSGCSCPN